MTKQVMLDKLNEGLDCWFTNQQVIDMLSKIEDAPDTKDKVWFTEQHLIQFLGRFRSAILIDIEECVSGSDLVRDEDCEIYVNGREITVEVNSFNISEIEIALSRSVEDFLKSEELFM